MTSNPRKQMDKPTGTNVTIRHNLVQEPPSPMHATGHVLRLEITATSRPDLPKELFLFHRRPIQTIFDPIERTGEHRFRDVFCAVCTMTDIVTYPVDKPFSSFKVPLFRKSDVSIILSTAEECYTTLRRIQECLQVLCDAIDASNDLIMTPEYKIGN